MPSISTWIVLVLVAENSTSRSTTKAWQARAVTVAPTQLAAIYASAPQAANPMQQTAGCHTCFRPGSHGPLFRSQIWVMVLVGAAPIPPPSCARPALGGRQPGV
jgi:hypothetical protein